MELARTTLRLWVDLLAQQLEATGVAASRAGAIALATPAGMEGALILCRAEGGPGTARRGRSGIAAALAALKP
jgi:hypothetical protein